MNAKTVKRIRKAISLRASGPTQYEKPELHHVARVPTYEKHERTLRSWDPQLRKIIARTVEKIRYGRDGKTPLRPVMQLVDVPGADGTPMGEKVAVPQFEIIPIAKPRRLLKASARAVYKTLKRLERTVGLDAVYDQLADEAAAGVPA